MNYELYCSDAYDFVQGLEDKAIDVIFTSPPFKPKDMGLTPMEYWEKMDKIYKEFIRVTSKVICVIQSSSNMNEYIRRYNPKRTIIWGKGQILKTNARYSPIFIHQLSDDFKVNSYVWADCFGVMALKSKNKIHPYQDPVELYRVVLDMFARKKTIRTVFDPFMGAGTTGIACAALGLNFVGIEKDEEHFQVAVKKITEAYEEAKNNAKA